MNISNIPSVDKQQWKAVKRLYLEAFPKPERKPFFILKRSVQKGRAQLLTAAESVALLGFVMVIPHGGTVMVDYLAVDDKNRSRGTGSRIIREVLRRFPGKKLVLLIEKPDEAAQNSRQRTARRNFYLKNGFTSSGIFITGRSGSMEVMNYGGTVSLPEYLELQRHALGNLMFRLSGIKPAA